MKPPTRAQLRELAKVYRRAHEQTRSVEEALRAVLLYRLEPSRSEEANAILAAVAKRFEMAGPTALFERTRRRHVVEPRQVAMTVMRMTDMGYGRISASFGLRDETTSLHAVTKVQGTPRLWSVAVDVAQELGIIEKKGRAA